MPLSPRLLRPRADSRAEFPHNPNALVLVIDTSKEPSTLQASIWLTGTVNATINWGDGTVVATTGAGFKTHTYAAAGIYVVQVTGTVTAMDSGAGGANNKAKVVRCLSFGTVGLTSLTNVFRGCTNLVQVPATLPSGVTSLFFSFAGCPVQDARMNNWNTSNVTNMSSCFSGNSGNNDISAWDTSNVTDMSSMFNGNAQFNRDISGWSTQKVTNMASMFLAATAFNRPIGSWNTSSVTNMSSMFGGTNHTFNQDIGGWNTANVTSMQNMFSGANHAFAQDISGWDIRKVTTMATMFTGSAWGTANYDAALEDWADLADTDLTIGTTANTSQAITAFAQQGANTRVTSNGHGLVAGSRVNISGTTSYNGDFNVVAVPSGNQFDIAVTFVANDATGTMKHRRSRNVTAGFGTNKYNAGAPTTARGVLTTTYDWSITDGGQV